MVNIMFSRKKVVLCTELNLIQTFQDNHRTKQMICEGDIGVSTNLKKKKLKTFQTLGPLTISYTD